MRSQVCHFEVDELKYTLAHEHRTRKIPWVAVPDRLLRLAPKHDVSQLFERKDPRLEAVVDIVRVVRDRIREINPLRFQQGGPLGFVFRIDGHVVAHRVLPDGLAGFERQVQTRKLRIPALQDRHDAQALDVVLEPSVILHALVKRVLPGVPERRVPQVVAQCQNLAEVLVEAEHPGDRAGDLRRLHAVRQARAVVITLVIDEHLRFVFEPAERRGVNDTVPVALKAGAVGMLRLVVNPSEASAAVSGIGSQVPGFTFLQILTGNHAAGPGI